MRKTCLLIAVLSLSALAFVSCKKDDKAGTAGDMMSFTATIDNGGAKTVIDGVNVKWTSDDKISINGKPFDAQVEGDGTTAVFTGEALVATEYEAYYPVSLYDETKEKYVLPATQKYAGEDGEVLSGVNPMYAKSSTTDLQFYNICAIMKLVVKGKGIVKTITVSADQPLSGAFKVKSDPTVGFYAELEQSSKDAATVTLDCGDGIELEADKDKTFYIALPHGEYTNLKFTYDDGDDGTWSSEAFSVKLTAGKMRTKEQTGVSVVKLDYLPGKFSVAAGKRVQFSCGNLQYYCGLAPDGKNWRFAENQWDMIDNGPTEEHVTSDYAENSGAWIDLFGYGTSGQEHGATCYQPWSTSNDDMLYYAYNLYDNGGLADWGYSYCKQENVTTNTWRTLTGGDNGEWFYMFNTRTNAENLYGNGSIDGTHGLILLPDDWSCPDDLQFTPGVSVWANAYSLEQWFEMESAGAVFLPAAGYRMRYVDDEDNYICRVNSEGNYRSSSKLDGYSDAAYILIFDNEANSVEDYNKSDGYSVRLVRVAK